MICRICIYICVMIHRSTGYSVSSWQNIYLSIMLGLCLMWYQEWSLKVEMWRKKKAQQNLNVPWMYCIISYDETLKLKHFSCDKVLDHRSMSSRKHRTLLLSVNSRVVGKGSSPEDDFMSKQSKTAWNTFCEIPWPKHQFVTCSSGSRSLLPVQ